MWVVYPMQVASTAGTNFAKHADAIFFETSAKESINVHELFKTIGNECRQLYYCMWKHLYCTRVFYMDTIL